MKSKGKRIFALKHAWQCRKALKGAMGPTHTLPELKALTVEMLRARKIRCLVLDFDGVMASHAACEMHSEIHSWLEGLGKVWPLKDVAVLSNKPFDARIKALARSFPEIQFVEGVPPKPYPEGLLTIARQRGLAPYELLLVDDRLCTGMLAVVLAGAQGILILRPYQNYRKRPLAELYFATLRHLERFLIGCLG